MFTELKLTAKVPQPVGFFGQAVSIGGDYAIVGAGQSSSLNLGAAYIFARNGSTWAEQAKLTNRDGAPFDALGPPLASIRITLRLELPEPGLRVRFISTTATDQSGVNLLRSSQVVVLPEASLVRPFHLMETRSL